MIIELNEREIDPDPQIPSFLSTSSRDVIETTCKTLAKSGSTFLLRDPPSVIDFLYQSFALLQLSKLNNSDKLPFVSILDNLKLFHERSLRVGPISRRVYRDKDWFQETLETIKSTTSTTWIADLDKLTRFNVPEHVKYVAAPYCGIDNKVEFRFLSQFCAMTIASAISSELEVFRLKKLGFDWQIGEQAVLYGLMDKPLCSGPNISDYIKDDWRRAMWELYRDPGYSKKLSKSDLYDDGKQRIDSIPYITKRVLFSNNKFECNDISSELESNAIYCPIKHNFAVGEYFSVDHVNKTVNIYQVTHASLKDHAFKVGTLKSFFDGMKLLESGYKAALYIFIPNSQRTQCGSAFDVSLDNKGVKVLKSLDGVKRIARQQQKEEQKGKGFSSDYADCRHMLLLDTFIVRFPYFPGIPRIILAK
jgi:hypothetical protein